MGKLGVVNVAEDTWFAYLRYLGATTPLNMRATSELTSISMDADIEPFNSVFDIHLSGSDMDSRVGSLLREYGEKGLSSIWWVGPSPRPVDLEAHLLTCGLQAAPPLASMEVDLSQVSLTAPANSHLVRSRDDLDRWIQVITTSRHTRPEHAAILRQLYSALSMEDTAACQHVTVTADRAPMACVSVFISGDIAGIYNIGVSPGGRGQGYGTSVLSAALAEARRRGCSRATLITRPAATPQFERLGFARGPELTRLVAEPAATC